MPARIILNHWNRDGTISYSEQKHLTFMLQDGSLSIHLLKAMVLQQKTRTLCENQLVSSHRFEKHFKWFCAQNSQRLFWMLVDEKTRVEEDCKQWRRPFSGGQMHEDWVVLLSWYNQIWQSWKAGPGSWGLEFGEILMKNVLSFKTFFPL